MDGIHGGAKQIAILAELWRFVTAVANIRKVAADETALGQCMQGYCAKPAQNQGLFRVCDFSDRGFTCRNDLLQQSENIVRVRVLSVLATELAWSAYAAQALVFEP